MQYSMQNRHPFNYANISHKTDFENIYQHINILYGQRFYWVYDFKTIR